MNIVVIGGGLSGLAAAGLAADAGADVTLLERSGVAGGRARSDIREGFIRNMGPHALYRNGGERVLDRLGVDRRGASPDLTGGQVEVDGVQHPLPLGPAALLGSPVLSWKGRIQVARIFASLSRAAADDALATLSWRRWLDEHVTDPTARRLMEGLGRLSTYSADDGVSAQVALTQASMRKVIYLHGGWQRLVDGLLSAAADRGVDIRQGVRAEAIRRSGRRWIVETPSGAITADGVVVAGPPPAEAARLLGDVAPADVLTRMEQAIPVRAAVLDLALDALPVPDRPFVVGLTDSTYLSVHSRAARLAPVGGAVVHVARYLQAGDHDAVADRAALEGLMDRTHPGWRDHVVAQRFLPSITAIHDLAPASMGGLPGRVAGPIAPGLAVAGDWVGPSAWLADAALVSAEAAVAAVFGALQPAGSSSLRSSSMQSPSARVS